MHKKKNNLVRFNWKNTSETDFKNALCQENIQQLMNEFVSRNFNSSNEEVEKFNKIIFETAKISLKQKRPTKKKQSNHKKWFDSDCKNAKKRLLIILKQLNSSQSCNNSQHLRSQYFIAKKQYKKLLKKKHREYKHLILENIKTLNSSNKEEFWKCLKNLRHTKKRQKTNISSEQWVEHFQSLLSEKADESDNVECGEFPSYDTPNNEILDRPFSDREIHDHISKLKFKKASGLDGISNEMIKHGRFYLVPVIKKLFNNILNSACFPSQWNSGIILPIYKKGDENLPSNYRGITLASCLGKLFTSILQTRYMNFLVKNKKLNDEQFGFRPNSRTTDNLFIFQQLIHKYFSEKKKIYTCFIDYEKAFDSVWHKGLITKLKNVGVSGKFLNLVKSMYEHITSCVQLDQASLSETFSCNKGIMQGDSLSPVLFTTFMNDIPNFLKKQNCPGVCLKDKNINCLMFADDLILMSPTAQGLQASIDALSLHAKKWKLKVNVNKTNVMIFKANGHYKPTQKFLYNNQNINIVDQQNYLGLTMTPSGKFTLARINLSNKAKKTLAFIRSLMSNCTHIPISVMSKLFDSLIKPILLYGVAVWGPELLAYKTSFDKSIIEQFHIKFCKQILNLPFYTSNIKVRAELGRFPMIIDIKKHIISNYLRLKNNITNSILQEAFEYAFSHVTDFYNIMQDLKPFLSTHANSSNKLQIKSASKKVEKHLKDRYKERFFSNLQEETSSYENKILYKEMKSDYKMEQYLSHVNYNPHRIALSKFRLNAHKLRINSGSYENKGGPLPVGQRTCKYCPLNCIENEKHFILECNYYEDFRKKYFEELSKLIKNFSNFSGKGKVIALLNCQDKKALEIIGKFLHEMYSKRIVT